MSLSAFVADAPLRMGASGNAVTSAQLALKACGYPLKGTGYFGSATDAAVEDFQRRHGLKVDGEIGPVTAAAIDAARAAPITLPAEVARPIWLQVSLSHLGLHEAPGSRADNPELVRDIQEVAPDYLHDETPWCAGWVSFCLARAGLKPSRSPLWALSYADGWGVRLAGPAVGAVAVKSRTGGGHVTFVAGRTPSGLLACCGGNQNDQVSIAGYAASAFNHGFWWPKGNDLPAHVGLDMLPIINASGAILREA